MTMIRNIKVQCALCGSQADGVFFSTIRVEGYQDLDTRSDWWPILHMVKRCPKCGYCASDVSKRGPNAEEVLVQTKYQEQLENKNFPELTNSYICRSMINAHAGEKKAAMWSLIYAAWVCDDQGLHQHQSVVCRNLAISMFHKVAAEGQFVSEKGREIALLVDLLRRAGRLEEAAKTIGTALEESSDPVLHKLLNYQRSLVQSNDLSCHKAHEALGHGNSMFWLYPPDDKEPDNKSSAPRSKNWWQFWK